MSESFAPRDNSGQTFTDFHEKKSWDIPMTHTYKYQYGYVRELTCKPSPTPSSPPRRTYTSICANDDDDDGGAEHLAVPALALHIFFSIYSYKKHYDSTFYESRISLFKFVHRH